MKSPLGVLPVCLGALSLSCTHQLYRPQTYTQAPAALPHELHRTVEVLADEIGERNLYRSGSMERSCQWLERELKKTGLKPTRDTFAVKATAENKLSRDTRASNIIAEIRGTIHPEEILIIGAHYDTKVATPGWHDHSPVIPAQRGTPGANDNGSGVACTLALAKAMSGHRYSRTIRFCFWANEEPPFYQTEGEDSSMGSYVYARRCAYKQEKIIGMISPETMGCYSPQPHSKRSHLNPLPGWIGLPETPDYIAFQSNLPSADFTRKCAVAFSKHSRIPVRVCALATPVKRAAWSDDWSFWQFGWPAFSTTDTAYLRADHYHEWSDTPDHLDYIPFADAVWGLKGAVESIAGKM